MKTTYQGYTMEIVINPEAHAEFQRIISSLSAALRDLGFDPAGYFEYSLRSLACRLLIDPEAIGKSADLDLHISCGLDERGQTDLFQIRWKGGSGERRQIDGPIDFMAMANEIKVTWEGLS